MPKIQELYRDLHSNIDYLGIKYRQKYYSNDENPRLIQTRLKNQPLLSLRTLPHDKYLIKPGEFLSIDDSKSIIKSPRANYVVSDNDYSKYLRSDYLDSKKFFGGFDDSVIIDNIDIPELKTPLRRVKSSNDLMSYNHTGVESMCYCHCHNHEEESKLDNSTLIPIDSPQLSPTSRKLRLKEKVRNGFGISRYLSSQNLISSPVLDLDTLLDTSKEEQGHQLKNNSEDIVDKEEDKEKDDELNINKLRSCPNAHIYLHAHKPSAVQSILNKISVSSSSHTDSISNGNTETHNCISLGECNCIKCLDKRNNNKGEVWKKVFNEVSLSAARVSSGSTPTPRHDFENLTSDFTDVKSTKSVDVFADTLSQAKMKYMKQNKENEAPSSNEIYFAVNENDDNNDIFSMYDY